MTVVELTGSRLDDWWERLMSRRFAPLIWNRGGPLIVLIVAALARLVGLGYPHQLVFDETYYVKDAWTLMHLGYEGSWPGNPDAAFNAGDPSHFTDTPSFVAHPPIGKWIIAAGLAVFGGGDSVGWRISVALCGILLIALTMVLAHLLFRRTLLTVIAGGLIAIDGNAIVLSRVALLDTMVATFGLIGVILMLLDRRWTQARLAGWVARRQQEGKRTDWGPMLWWRPWLMLAAVSFGLMAGTKWSGAYFLAIWAVYSVISELLLRKRAGIEFWASSTVFKQSWVSFLLAVPLAVVVYIASWTGWFVTKGGYYRDIAGGAIERWHGALSWVPLSFQSWWHYQSEMYNYNVNLRTPHSYQANPLTWLFLARPTSMYYKDFGNGTAGTILDVANPLIWWSATAAVFFLTGWVVWGAIRRRSVWREAFVLTGLAAGYLPWLLYLNRTVFQFYSIAFEPYLILGLTVVIGMLIGTRADPERHRVSRLQFVGLFLGLCVVLSIFFLPMWTGQPIPQWYMRLHFWFPSWI